MKTQSQIADEFIRRLRASAQAHKRLAQNQRRLSKFNYELINDIVAFCGEHGIVVNPFDDPAEVARELGIPVKEAVRR